MLTLKPPLVLTPEDYAKKYIQLGREMDKIYPTDYPNTDQEGLLEIDFQNAREREERVKKNPGSIYFKDEENKKQMTFVQSFTMSRIYNVNLYMYHGAPIVHFKDVVSVLAKTLIENKYKVDKDISYQSTTIETMLMDRWVSTYPSRPH